MTCHVLCPGWQPQPKGWHGHTLWPRVGDITRVLNKYGIAATQLLKGLIGTYGREMGTTETGRAFCIKALHPSDATLDVEGVPDKSACPTTMINFTQTTVIRPPGVIDWEGEIYFIPDPATFASIYTRDAAPTLTADCVHNAQFGTDVVTASNNWSAAFNRHRLVYYGATIYLDAPALADQGSFVAAQYQHSPVDLCHVAGSYEGVSRQRVVRWGLRDVPSMNTLMGYPNSYSGKAKDGCYIPLKLDSNHAEWHNTVDDVVFDGSAWALNGANTIVPSVGVVASTMLYPNLDSAYWTDLTKTWAGERHMMPCNATLGCLAFSGISKDATIRIVVRCGYECQPMPGSVHVTYMKSSPEYDPLALDSYYFIARQLKDAYPAEYNDFGKLWGVIKSAIAKAAPLLEPALRMIPGVGPGIVEVAKLVGKGGDLLASASNARRKRKAQKQMSATDKEAVKDEVRKALTMKRRG